VVLLFSIIDLFPPRSAGPAGSAPGRWIAAPGGWGRAWGRFPQALFFFAQGGHAACDERGNLQGLFQVLPGRLLVAGGQFSLPGQRGNVGQRFARRTGNIFNLLVALTR